MSSFDFAIPATVSPIQAIFISGLIFAISYYTVIKRPSFDAKSPPVTSGDWPIIGDLGFWTARRDWWLQSMKGSRTGNFSFHVGKHRLVATSSDEGRKAFFESKNFGFSEGYAVLFGQGPDIAAGQGDQLENKEEAQHFSKRITALLKRDQFMKALPTLMSDVRSRLDELAAQSPGMTDPFDSIYKIVYLLTMRAVGAAEIARDRKKLDLTLSLFETIEKTATAYQVMFPWLPSPALFRRFFAGTRMYLIFQKIVKGRKDSERREEDALQFLLDQGDDMNQIIAFVVGALFAGQLNSGINAAWVLCYLASNPHWLSEVRKEVHAAADKHVPGSEPLIDRLSKLPLEAWENDFPLVDLCLKDSIRLQLPGSGFRKNTSGRDLVIDGEIVPKDGFLLYHIGEHHLNPNIYEDPEKWDPSRYFPERAEDKKNKFAFLGWGAGRHPCLGMRFAKLEQNIITAFFCAMFDFELVDPTGTKMNAPIPPNHNNWSATFPDSKMFLRYNLRKDLV